VERLMRELEHRGVVSGKELVTTRPDPAASARPPDVV
jgi:hypothetical protein